jgi:alkylhydroperoxidase family enzyme
VTGPTDEQPIEQLRAMVAAAPPPPAELAPYLDKVRSGAYAVTDADVAALSAAGFSDDEIFDHTVAVAVAQGLRRLDAGLGAIG